MWTREKAMKIRKMVEKAAISLTDADASIAPEMFPDLKATAVSSSMVRASAGRTPMAVSALSERR